MRFLKAPLYGRVPVIHTRFGGASAPHLLPDRHSTQAEIPRSRSHTARRAARRAHSTLVPPAISRSPQIARPTRARSASARGRFPAGALGWNKHEFQLAFRWRLRDGKGRRHGKSHQWPTAHPPPPMPLRIFRWLPEASVTIRAEIVIAPGWGLRSIRIHVRMSGRSRLTGGGSASPWRRRDGPREELRIGSAKVIRIQSGEVFRLASSQAASAHVLQRMHRAGRPARDSTAASRTAIRASATINGTPASAAAAISSKDG